MRTTLFPLLAALVLFISPALASVDSGRRQLHKSLAVKRQGGGQFDRRATTFRYGGASQNADTVRGVALGAWLVLESFIVPSVFNATGNDKVVDEWTFGSLVPRDKATKILSDHLNTFITEDDIAQIAAAGLNHVRVPIGFWAFNVTDQEPYLKLNQWDLMKQAALWCAKYNIKMWADLHGLPGSQNGYDHSGHLGGEHWADNQTNIDRSLDIVETMAQEFSKAKYANTVTIIEVVNEPVGMSKTILKQYYKDGYARVRKHSQDIIVSLGDGFIDPGNPAWNTTWRGFMNSNTGFNRVSMDTHFYTVFDDYNIRLTAAQRQAKYCAQGNAYAYANNFKWQMAGEWTPAFTDCAQNLLGRGKGHRYDGSLPGSQGFYKSCASKVGPASGFSDGYKALLARFFQVQKEAAERGAGWVMWTWKTEAGTAEDWSYKAGLGKWIPNNLDTSITSYHC